MSSLSKTQINSLGCILDVLELEHPDFDDLTPEQIQALVECFKSLAKTKEAKEKGGKGKKSKEKSEDGLKKPGNTWIAWLNMNRESMKAKNGGKEEGLPALLSKAYSDFKKTPAYGDLQKECAEKMKEYKEKSDASDDDEPKKKSKKTKKVEKSSEEKKPLNVYMAFSMAHLDQIKAYATKNSKSFNEAKQEMYAKFKTTADFKTLDAKCKADLKRWNEANEKAPKKPVEPESESDSESDEVVPPKTKTKVNPKKKAVVSVSESPLSESPKVEIDEDVVPDEDDKVKIDEDSLPDEDEKTKKTDKKSKKAGKEKAEKKAEKKKAEKKKAEKKAEDDDEMPIE
jgi:hypothetical protein